MHRLRRRSRDPAVAKVCDEENRILVTFDRGFANIKTFPPAHHAGMIVFRLKRQDKPHVLTVSARLLQALRARPLRNELWIVHEQRIHIRFRG